MCQHKSAIWTRKGLLYSLRWDSHEKIIEENKLKDNSMNPDFVRIEFLPKNGIWEDYLKPENYRIQIDQDFRPDWFSVDDPKLKKQCVEMIKKVWDETFIIDKEGLELKDKLFYIKNSKRIVAWGNSSVVARGNSSVVAWGNSSVVARGNSSVEAWENSSVVAWENSSVVARGNSSVEAWENSSVVAWENSSVVARGNSSVVAWENSSVEAWENSSVILYDNSKIKQLNDNATYLKDNIRYVVNIKNVKTHK